MTIRNIAIIAHVDHGKTTLVDALLRQSNTKLEKYTASELIMDSNELERERGITIFSKNASVLWHDTKINIIDTPGHADFGGEVERVLSMADGCLLLVDAKEGPMPQTRFVLKHALKAKLAMIIVINKIDKSDARPAWALNQTLELLLELGGDNVSLDIPIIYAIAKQGKAGTTAEIEKMKDITPLFESIVKNIPSPDMNTDAPLQMRVTTLTADNFKGRIGIGRIHHGIVRAGQEVMHINRAGIMKPFRLMALMTFQGLNRVNTDEATAGDIVAIAGIPDVMIGETIADMQNPLPLPLLAIEKPTVKMTFSINDSPFAGREGQFTTSRQIRERLMTELETDTALRVEDAPQGTWQVSGRGELHLAILIERMRREGYELQVSRPQVITREIDGVTQVPFDRVYIEVPDEFSGIVMQKMGSRYGALQEMKSDKGITLLEFSIPTRGLFGYRSEFLTDTRGLGIINTIFEKYAIDPGKWKVRDRGSLVATDTGTTTLHALTNLQDRGELFLGSAITVYQGQVVGQNNREGDIPINVCKEKQLSNMRSKGEGGQEHFNTPRTMNLEASLEYIDDTELVEVTPLNVRIRKMILDEREAKRAAKGMG